MRYYIAMDHTDELYNLLKESKATTPATSTGDDEERSTKEVAEVYPPVPKDVPPADQLGTGTIAAHKDTREGVVDRSLSSLQSASKADKTLISENLVHGKPMQYKTHSLLLQKSGSKKVAHPKFQSIKEQILKIAGRT